MSSSRLLEIHPSVVWLSMPGHYLLRLYIQFGVTYLYFVVFNAQVILAFAQVASNYLFG